MAIVNRGGVADRKLEEADPVILAVRVSDVEKGLPGFLFEVKELGAFQPVPEPGDNLTVERALVNHYPVVKVSPQVSEKMVERSVPAAHLFERSLFRLFLLILWIFRRDYPIGVFGRRRAGTACRNTVSPSD